MPRFVVRSLASLELRTLARFVVRWSLPVVLTTHTERNVVFYRRSGFALASRREVAPGGDAYAVWSMHRSAARD